MARRKIEQHRPVANFPVIDPRQFDNVTFPPDIAEFRKKIEDQYLTPHHLSTPGPVLQCLFLASTADGQQRSSLLEKARQKAEVHYLASWAKGDIKVKDPDIKPMPEEVKAELKEIKLQRKMEKQLQRSKKLPKLPTWQDKVAQVGYCNNYPWIIDGTFRQDSDNLNKTIVDIKCQICKSTRTVHLADVFQIKYCLQCRGKNAKSGSKSIVGKQSNSKSNSVSSTNGIQSRGPHGATDSSSNGRSVGDTRLQSIRSTTPGGHRQINQQGTRPPTRSKI